jgi:hypothetical protein
VRSAPFTNLASRALLLSLALACLGAVGFLLVGGDVLRQVSRASAMAAVCALPLAGIGLAYLALRRASAAQRIAAEVLAAGLCLIVLEAALHLWGPRDTNPQLVRIKAAEKLGRSFDARTISEVVDHLRSKGVDALPGTSREWPRRQPVRERLPGTIYPLSNASNASIVECNERGEYMVYRSDEFGFNNPPGLIASGQIDLAVVGESYALGHCLPAEQSLVGLLRKSWPRTGNFALGGSRALSTLASFREYVEPLRPPVILWTVYPYYVEDGGERQDATLRRYLDPDFSQNLFSRQAEVDRIWREISIDLQARADRAIFHGAQNVWGQLARAASLPLLREQATSLMWGALGNPDTENFARSLRLAKKASDGWGGRLVVVILPIFSEVVANRLPAALSHDRLAQTVRAEGIEVVDAAELFMKQPDPASLYTMRMNNHPNARGYALLEEHVQRRLTATTVAAAAR